tara:strand:+ start:507 stop:812 length:306 start_codon:yes stop_codon:yes gene_type:complete
VHHKHHHSLSLLSGILYLTEPANTIFFHESLYSIPLISSIQTEEKFNYSAKKGSLIIFPSILKHCVGPHLGDESRITFSFNTWFKGDLGDPKKSRYLPEKF